MTNNSTETQNSGSLPTLIHLLIIITLTIAALALLFILPSQHIMGIFGSHNPATPEIDPFIAVEPNTKYGDFLVDRRGMALYIFDADEPNVSNCSFPCDLVWPPVAYDADEPFSANAGIDGTFGLLMRDDGKRQLTFKGQPLYYYVGDLNAGETTGHGADGEWWLVSP